MGAKRKPDLEHRLETYFATLRSGPRRDPAERRAGHWQLYAAVTGSAMAMVTGASASVTGTGMRDISANPLPRALAAEQLRASSRRMPFTQAVILAMAKRDAGARIGRAATTQAPAILPGGVVPLCGTANVIQPGEWVSIYGTNLASQTAVWNGDFPISLGGTSVEINGRAAFLVYVSAGQINLQAPDDTATGVVSVVVKTAAGTATSTVTLSPYAPAFDLLDARHVAGIILRPNGSGAYGGGSYDILGPTGNSLGYRTVAAHAGDTVEIFSVGFGPTTPFVPAGEAFAGSAPVNNPISLSINSVPVTPNFVGLSSAGLYQINLTVPVGLGEGDVPILAIAGGMQTQSNALFSLQSSSYGGSQGSGGGSGGGGGASGGGGGGTGSGFGGGQGGGAGTGGGTGGGAGGGGGSGGGSGGSSGGGAGSGTGGGTGAAFRALPGWKPYQPKLRFPPK